MILGQPVLIALALAIVPQSGKTYALREGELTDPTLVPLALERPLALGLAGALLPAPRSFEEQGRKLRIDTNGDGRMDKTISASKASIVEFDFDGEGRSLLLYSKEGDWMASPARLWRVKIGKSSLELLDANMDGEFEGREDWLRWKGGCFFRQEVKGLLPTENGLARFELVPKSGRLKLTLESLPRPEWANDLQWEALLAVNELRNASGLGPWTLDMERSIACQKHAEYLYLNNYDYKAPWDGVGSHDEIEGNPGFSKEGREAARNSSTSSSNDPAGTVIRQFQTMLHRTGYLGSSTSPFAVGSVDRSQNTARGYSVLWGSEPTPASIRDVVVHPAPGQVLSELAGRGERPPVEHAPNFYGRTRGYPISVSFGRQPLQNIELLVFAMGEKGPLQGELFTPERPIHSSRPSNAHTAFFSPEGPLKPGKTYRAEFRATDRGSPVQLIWYFNT